MVIKRVDKESKEWAQKIATNRLHKTLINLALRIGKYFVLVLTEEGREFLSDPERRRKLFYREARVGLLESSIFQNPLYIPNEYNSMERRGTVTGRWIGYDFNRPGEFGKNCRQLQEGRLVSFLLNEIKDNPASTYTSTEIIDVFHKIEHIAQLELPPIDYLKENGLIVQTTYAQAYQNVNLFQKYEKAMNLERITNDVVYQITPKGNSLVFLARGGGDYSSEKFSFKDLVLAPSIVR